MKVVVVGIEIGGLFQELLALNSVSGGQVDHPGVIEQVRVYHAERECAIHFVEGFGDSTAAEESPGEGLPGRVVLPQVEILGRPFSASAPSSRTSE